MNAGYWMVVIILIIIFTPLILYSKAELDHRKNTSIIFLKESNTIRVLSRGPKNKKKLYSQRVNVMQNEYVPASVTITAATVGGVTTGGIDVKDAHYDTNRGSKIDRYYLMFKDKVSRSEHYIVQKVELSSYDAEIAKKNPVLAQFLKGETLELQHPIKSNKAAAARSAYQSSGDFYASANMLAEDIAYSNMTDGEVNEVISFLCGN